MPNSPILSFKSSKKKKSTNQSQKQTRKSQNNRNSQTDEKKDKQKAPIKLIDIRSTADALLFLKQQGYTRPNRKSAAAVLGLVTTLIGGYYFLNGKGKKVIDFRNLISDTRFGGDLPYSFYTFQKVMYFVGGELDPQTLKCQNILSIINNLKKNSHYTIIFELLEDEDGEKMKKKKTQTIEKCEYLFSESGKRGFDIHKFSYNEDDTLNIHVEKEKKKNNSRIWFIENDKV